jgi:2-polyprenyl-3-methyl-5-hydroxy-6-metoxy-1,4-benzoquinol methylase
VATRLGEMVRQRWNRDRIYSRPEYWDSKSDEYEGTAVSGWPNRSLNALYHEQEVRLLRRWLPSVEDARLLDIGCGTGKLARHLAGRGASVVGVDFSPKAIEIATRESPAGNPCYQVGSVFELQEHDEFDVVLSIGCLVVACADREGLMEVLGRIRAALKPGGRLVLVEPIHRGPLHFVLNMSLREFRDAVRDAGFEIDDVTGFHFWPLVRVLGATEWPPWVTVAGYRLGERALALGGRKVFSDYKALRASRT